MVKFLLQSGCKVCTFYFILFILFYFNKQQIKKVRKERKKLQKNKTKQEKKPPFFPWVKEHSRNQKQNKKKEM